MTVVVVPSGGRIATRRDATSGAPVPGVGDGALIGALSHPGAPALELDEFASVPSFDVHDELAQAGVLLQLALAADVPPERALAAEAG